MLLNNVHGFYRVQLGWSLGHSLREEWQMWRIVNVRRATHEAEQEGLYCVISLPESIVETCSGVFNFWVSQGNPMMWPFKWNLLDSKFAWYHLFFFNIL